MKKLACIFFSLFFFSHLLFASQDPLSMLEETATKVIAILDQNKTALKTNHEIIYSAVKRYLLPNVDITGMSRSALGRQAWMKASPSEQTQFSQAFTELVIRTYATPLAEYKDEKIKFMSQRTTAGSRFARVSSVVIRPGRKDLTLNYSLVLKNGQWKIYDLSVEGISLLQSFKTQFSQTLQHNSLAELIKQMQNNQGS